MEETYVTNTNRTLAQTFLWMFLGLASTGIIAAFTYYTGAFVNFIDAWSVILIAQVIIAIVFGLCFHKLSTGMVTLLFFAYSMLMRSYFFGNICCF